MSSLLYCVNFMYLSTAILISLKYLEEMLNLCAAGVGIRFWFPEQTPLRSAENVFSHFVVPLHEVTYVATSVGHLPSTHR